MFMKWYLIVLSFILIATGCFAQSDKAEQMNKKIVDREESRFQKELRKHPTDALTYLEHADNLAAMNSEYKRAFDFYLLALKYDTLNPAIYKNCGKYLAERLHMYTEAKKMLDRGVALAPADQDLKNCRESVNNIIAAQDADNRMKGFGTTSVREFNPGGSYASASKFDSLKLLVDQPGNKFYYPAQLARFLADDRSLTPEEMYMLIVAFSKQAAYSPFNYNDIFEVRMIAGHNIDSAIKKGIELTHTNPLNPSLNRELMYYYRKNNDIAGAEKYLFRIQQFFNGVLYSGNGSCDKPYISLWAKEEYNFITYLGYQATDIHSMTTCAGQMAELIEATNPSTQKNETIHFNVAPIYIHTVGK